MSFSTVALKAIHKKHLVTVQQYDSLMGRTVVCPACGESMLFSRFVRGHCLGGHKSNANTVIKLHANRKKHAEIMDMMDEFNEIKKKAALSRKYLSDKDVSQLPVAYTQSVDVSPVEESPIEVTPTEEKAEIEEESVGVKSCPHCGGNLELYNILHIALQKGNRIDPVVLRFALERASGVDARRLMKALRR